MITITLDVDGITDTAYQNLSPEKKKLLNCEISVLLEKTIINERTARIKQILDEIAKDTSGTVLNAEILYELLRDGD